MEVRSSAAGAAVLPNRKRLAAAIAHFIFEVIRQEVF